MRVLYLIEDIEMRGSARSIISLLKANREMVSSVVIIPSEGRITECLREMEIEYYVVPFDSDICNNLPVKEEMVCTNFLSSFKAARRTASIAIDECVDLVHINTSNNTVGAMAALLGQLPYVWNLREITWESSDGDFYNPKFKALLMRNADSLIAVSDFVKKCFRDRYGLACKRIYNGFDISGYESILSHSFKTTFMNAGYIYRYKGQYDAVRAIELIKQKNAASLIRLDIFGEGGNDYIRLKDYVNTNELNEVVTFHGFVDDLSEWRSKSSYALVCSKMEALPRVVIEAMLAGQIVIGADEGGTKEIIGADESRGFLYKRGDVKGLADLIERVLLLPDSKKIKIAQNAQKYVKEHFDINEIAGQFLELYKKVIAEHKQVDPSIVRELEDRYEKMATETDLESVSVSKPSKRISYMDIVNSSEFTNKLLAYIKDNHIQTLALYGMGKIGLRVSQLLRENSITISFVIDRDDYIIGDYMKVFDPDDTYDDADLFLITTVVDNKNIMHKLKSKVGERSVKCISDFFPA